VPALFLNALKLVFLALLYIVLFRVARSLATHAGVGIHRRRPGAEIVFVTSASQRGTRVPVRSAVVFGRSDQADVVLHDGFASDLHLRFTPEEEKIVLQDLGSTNGTYLNGRRISEPVLVAKGDIVQVGRTIMEVR